MEITVRRAEPSDCEAIRRNFADESMYSGTLHKAYALRHGAYADAYAMARIRAK